MSSKLKSPLLMLLAVAAFSGPAAAEVSADGALRSRPLNLTLPRDAVWTSPVRADVPGPAGVSRNSQGLPDLDIRSAGSRDMSGRMPYGTGYEARQRGSSSWSAGSAGGQGRRGMGRGR